MKTRNRIVFLLVLAAVLFLPILTGAFYEQARYPSMDIGSLETADSAGGYVVYVMKDGSWEKVGRLAFDKFYRDREIDLRGSLSEAAGNKIEIRLVQIGGGAAHIDSVFLGEKPPAEVLGVKDGVRKLSRSDFDVVDAFGKSIDLVFDSRGKDMTLSDLFFHSRGEDRTLRLVARVEPTKISKTPFKFPIENLFRKIDKTSRFYRYELNSRRGELMLDDGKLEEVTYWSPFFKQFSPTGSGHPEGFTYGWVSNDSENLYVAIDFTPDDTMDGNKDYAKVYVDTPNGLREFKVSEVDTKWGRPGFTYTDKVAYQHKVYKFKIPFTEIAAGGVPEELSLAFATYGTASPPNFIICKDANGSAQLFDFTATDFPPFQLQDSQESRCRVFTGFSETGAGAPYTITEIVPGGWRLADIQCNGENGFSANVDLPNHEVVIILGNEESEGKCTFINRPLSGVPSMTEWGMIVFILLAGLGAVYYLRRQKTTKN